MDLKVMLPQASMAERGQLVSDLRDVLQDRGISGSISRERPDSMDAGTILTIVLGAPAIVAAVKAIHDWLTRSNQSEADLVLPDGTTLKLRNMKSEDVDKAVVALQTKANP